MKIPEIPLVPTPRTEDAVRVVGFATVINLAASRSGFGPQSGRGARNVRRL
jgi:HD-like signal output (HDOD) protein